MWFGGNYGPMTKKKVNGERFSSACCIYMTKGWVSEILSGNQSLKLSTWQKQVISLHRKNPHTVAIHLVSEVASVLGKQLRNKCFYYAFLDSFQSLTFYNVCDT